MLCFDVKIDKEAMQYAEDVGVKIFSAEIIYHLFDSFTAHQKVCCPRAPTNGTHANQCDSKCWRPNVLRQPPRPFSLAS